MSALPDAVASYLECQFRRYRLQAINAGLNNRVWRLESDAGQHILRLHRATPQPNQASREQERNIWRVAAANGLAPELLHWSEDHSFSISCFVQQGKQPQALVKRLLQLHSLSLADLSELDYLSMLQSQLQQLKPIVAIAWQQKLAQWHARLQLSCLPKCLVHHDLNLSNMLFAASGVMFIDYEYAALGHPLWDLAACEEALVNQAQSQEQSQIQRDELWLRYLAEVGIQPSPCEQQAWQAAQKLYHLSCWLWFDATGLEPQQAQYHYQALLG